MKLYITEDYKTKKPELSGSKLTEFLILECLKKENCEKIKKDRVEIERTEMGKPYIYGGPHFSVSHSENLFACIIADRNIGIDIQHRRNIDIHKIAHRYYTEYEICKVEESDDEFFRIWARKEALAKYTGNGLFQVMRKEDVLRRNDVLFRDIMIRDDCFCAVCVERGVNVDEIQISG